MQQQGAAVKVGQRIYNGTTWSRQDEIYVEDRRIGIIKLSCGDRQGRTISLITHTSKHGRAVDWCVEQSTTNRPLPQPSNQSAADVMQHAKVNQSSVV
jgi:hypothetical protein